MNDYSALLPAGLPARVRLDRYAAKDPHAVLQVGDLVVVSVQRWFDHKKKDGESREIGIVQQINSQQHDVVVFKQSAPLSGQQTSGAVISTLPHQDSQYEILTGVPRQSLEYCVEKTWAEICHRVAYAVVQRERQDHLEDAGALHEIQQFADRVYTALATGKFAAAGRILAGLGRADLPDLTLFNCFVYAVPGDSRTAITQHLGRIFDTYSRGGGVGWSLSILRPKGAIVKKVNGRSSGVLTWAELWSHLTGAVEQGGSRMGAACQALDAWHPDVLDFVAAKSLREEFEIKGQVFSRNLNLIKNANVSVLISNEFMQAVKTDSDWDLVFPDLDDPEYDDKWTGDLAAWKALGKQVVVYRTIKAKTLWDLIADRAWASGEPGLVFIDRVNDLSNSYYYDKILCGNPCVVGDTRVHTSKGLIKARDLHETGDEVVVTTDARLPNGGGMQQASKMLCTGTKQVYRVHTFDGYQVTGTANHPVMTTDGWKEIGNLQVGDSVHVLDGHSAFGREGNADLGKVMGWLLGDGYISVTGSAHLDFYGSKKELAEEFVTIIHKMVQGLSTNNRVYTNKPCYSASADVLRVASSLLARFLAEFGVTNETYHNVPEVVFRGTEEMQRAFISALFSADGTVGDGGDKGYSVRLDSVSIDMLRDVQLLLLNFGIFSKIYQDRQNGNLDRLCPDGHGGSKVYHCQTNHSLHVAKQSLVTFYEKIKFLLPYKQEKLGTIVNRYTKGPYADKFVATVTAVEKLGREKVYDLTEPVTRSFAANGLVVHNCNEAMLPANGVCDLGHINVAAYVQAGPLPEAEVTAAEARRRFDWEAFEQTCADGVRFLDNVIDLNHYHEPGSETQEKKERRIGLGILGLGEALVRLGLRYGSAAALEFTTVLTSTLQSASYRASANLAGQRGAFPAFDCTKFLASGFMQQVAPGNERLLDLIREKGMRNVTCNTVAPTGSLAALLDTTGGVEPYFDLEYTSTTRIGTTEEQAKVVTQLVQQFGSDRNKWPGYVVTAQQGITTEQHVRMQAAAQRHIDAAIAKTINTPNSATREDVAAAYRLMWDLGCKGGTVYRDGSRDEQVLYTKAKVGEVPVVTATEPPKTKAIFVDDLRPAVMDKLSVGLGPIFSIEAPTTTLHIGVRHDPETGDPADLFFVSGYGDVGADVQAIGRLCSLVMRMRTRVTQAAKLELICDQLAGIPGSTQTGMAHSLMLSLPDAIAKVLRQYLAGEFPRACLPLGAQPIKSVFQDVAKLTPEERGSLVQYLVEAKAKTLLKEEVTPVAPVSAHKDFCPACHTAALMVVPGKCSYCRVCGFSKC
jgi:ribonucleoside-diphosphate reductase alpha chain